MWHKYLSQNGDTPLSEARKSGNKEIVQVLLDAGAMGYVSLHESERICLYRALFAEAFMDTRIVACSSLISDES